MVCDVWNDEVRRTIKKKLNVGFDMALMHLDGAELAILTGSFGVVQVLTKGETHCMWRDHHEANRQPQYGSS